MKVLGQDSGGEGNNIEKAQEGPGNGHGKGGGVDLVEETKAMADEFAPFMNPNTTLTPYLCRKGCKHYDSVEDLKNSPNS